MNSNNDFINDHVFSCSSTDSSMDASHHFPPTSIGGFEGGRRHNAFSSALVGGSGSQLPRFAISTCDQMMRVGGGGGENQNQTELSPVEESGISSGGSARVPHGASSSLMEKRPSTVVHELVRVQEWPKILKFLAIFGLF